VYYTLPLPSLKPSHSLETYMTNVLTWIALLTAGAAVVIAPICLMLLYKIKKENT
jgi:hypothetical protein